MQNAGSNYVLSPHDQIDTIRRCRTGKVSCRGMRFLPRRGGSLCGIAFAMLLAILTMVPAPAHAQRLGRVTEHDMIAAYIYNFALYFTWPSEAFPAPDKPFVIGVFGGDPIANALDKVARTKTARGRRIEIRRFQNWEAYRPCQIVFLPSTTGQDDLKEAIRRTGRTPALLVGKTPGFAIRGADVNFYPDIDGTIGFEINVDTVAARHLVVAAKLLKLARVVKNSPRPEAGD